MYVCMYVEMQQESKEEENVEEQESQTPTRMKQPEKNPENTRDTVEPLQKVTSSAMETTNQSQPETLNQRDQSVTTMLPETKVCAQHNSTESTADHNQQSKIEVEEEEKEGQLKATIQQKRKT